MTTQAERQKDKKMKDNALCNKSNGRCDIKEEKREELESKSSHKIRYLAACSI